MKTIFTSQINKQQLIKSWLPDLWLFWEFLSYKCVRTNGFVIRTRLLFMIKLPFQMRRKEIGKACLPCERTCNCTLHTYPYTFHLYPFKPVIHTLSTLKYMEGCITGEINPHSCRSHDERFAIQGIRVRTSSDLHMMKIM